ncbi:type I methionyl aminopeptidase [Candidatus Collierbacteria bacterium]|nr:type I methionyl aminopeptidase [Candidatus Collierbacteria bacterium]
MNQKKLQAMKEGGKLLGRIKSQLVKRVMPGLTGVEIDSLADELIRKANGEPSFKSVRGYHHATCITVNSGIVHGIPNHHLFQPSDLITIDLGLIYQGYHTDTSVTVGLPPLSKDTANFLTKGKVALAKAIGEALPGNTIYQVSQAMQKEIESGGFSVIRDLTGHGIGRHLHEPPHIPCFADPSQKNLLIKKGQALAIEVMYSMGDYRLKTEADGWTLSTKDNSLSAMFEETVFITETGNLVLTSPQY